MKKVELLAPAGNKESLIAAINAGADAIYLGGLRFGARSFANNFNDEDMIWAINYAHNYNVKVYVTINTLIYEDEVEDLINYVRFLHANSVDALIIQDIGMMHLIKTMFPNVELHASTQMHIHNIEGLKLLEEEGIKRAVVARETNIDLIRKMRNEVSIELEVFIQGALCISYSGQCLMSSLIGGRSGNRGSCAGPCRQKYKLIVKKNHEFKKIKTDGEYLLSTKDLFTINNIGELIDIGVNSFKIEGRMKRPEYVYLVTSLYRKAIDSYIKNKKIDITDKDIKELKKLFNRNFTKGFLFNDNNINIVNTYRPNHQGINIGSIIKKEKNLIYIKLTDNLNIGDGIRIAGADDDYGFTVNKILKDGKQINQGHINDIVVLNINKGNIGDKVLKTTDKEQLNNLKKAINNKKKIELNGKAYIEIGKPITLEISDGSINIKIAGDTPIQKAEKNGTPEKRIKEQLSKTGQTIYIFKNLEISLTDKVFIPIIELNNIRRKAIEKLEEEKKKKISFKEKKYSFEALNIPASEEYHNTIYINILKTYNNIKNKNHDVIYVNNEELYNQIKDDKRCILALNRVLEHHKEYSEPLLVGELGSIYKYNNVISDFSLNVVNSYSVYYLLKKKVKRVILSFEMTDKQIEDLIISFYNRYGFYPPIEIVTEANIPVMVSKYNIIKPYHNYNEEEQYYLEDRFNNKYPILIKDNYMNIYNYQKTVVNNLEKYRKLNIKYFQKRVEIDEN